MKETFGKRFQRLRKEKGLTQQDIADNVGITFQSVSKWEQDINLPDVNALLTLSDILGVSVDELLGKEKTTIIENSNLITDKILKIKITTGNEKVNVNLPVKLIQVLISSGNVVPGVPSSIDFNSVLNMIENGVVGELITIENDNELITISVE